MFIKRLDEIYCDFTKELNSYLIGANKRLVNKEYISGFYLYNPNIKNKEEWIAFRFPGATRGGIKINYDTYIIEDIKFCKDTFFKIISSSFDEKTFKEKWIGKKIN